ncbi:MAG: hypothetical protein IJV62_00520, partial [Eggerthellaceae bacterium]|nr:hypothetical protein [Eggerthellaceae bacterium]
MTKLKINYANLEAMSQNYRDDAARLGTLIEGLQTYKQGLREQTSLTTHTFIDMIDEAMREAEKQKEQSELMAQSISNYVNDMRKTMPAEDDALDIELDTEDIDAAIASLEQTFEDFRADITKMPLGDIPSLDEEVRAQQKRTYECCVDMHTTFRSSLERIETAIDNIKKIKTDVYDKAVEVDETHAHIFSEIVRQRGLWPAAKTLGHSFGKGVTKSIEDTLEFAGDITL